MENSELAIDSPLSLLPNLADWGIEETDRGVCEDNSANRYLIRENKARYQPVYSTDGKPTNLIQVITSQMRQAALSANKSIILTDDRNIDSDYLTGVQLIVEPASDHIVPAWVIAATRHWIDIAEQRKTNPNYRPAVATAPGRCVAKRIDGHRCASWFNGTRDYGMFCRMHQSNRPNGEDEMAGHLAKARNRIQSAALGAADTLEDLMYNATSEVVRKAAADSLLDRAGVRGGIEIDTNIIIVKPAADIVRERLERLREGAIAKQALEARMSGHSTEDDETEDIIDAEIVEVEVKND